MDRSLASGAVVSALVIGLIAPGVPSQGPAERAVAAWLFGASAVMAQSTTAPASAAAKHVMEGKVTKVDAKRGWIDVKTQEGSMKLHFPPAALEGVKAGDSVSVEVAMTTAPAPERSQKTK